MAPPITEVYDEGGRLVHSCVQAGCQVSWDGRALVDGPAIRADGFSPAQAAAVAALKPGDAVPGRPVELPATAVDHGDGTATTRRR